MKILLLCLIFSTSVFAKITTKYLWKLKDSEKMSSGACYEVDEKTLGQKFISRTKDEKCKPPKTLFIFFADNGYCYEVDEKTKGYQYYNKTEKENCKTKSTLKMLTEIKGIQGCFEVDAKTKGTQYFKKLKLNECNEQLEDQAFYFLPEDNGKGKCYTKNQNEEYIKVNLDLCRPEKIKYAFERINAFNGRCFEKAIDPKNAYKKQVKIDKCRTVPTEFVFVRDEKPENSKCYEIDSETKGDKFLSVVNDEKCLQ